MQFDTNHTEFASGEEKRVRLYREQVQTLSLFLARGAISQAQFDKSFADLTVKMGMQKEADLSSLHVSKKHPV